MANGQLIADRFPAVAAGTFYRLNIIDNGDSTCSVYVEDRLNSDGVSTPGGVTATGLQIKGVGAATPGGSNTQVQYNNNGVFGGVSGATSDGTNITFGSGNLRATLPQFTTAGFQFGANVVMRSVGAIGDESYHIGVGAGGSSTAVENLTVGGLAGAALTTGVDNTILGFGAGFNLAATSENVFVGTFAGFKNQGAQNVAVGVKALQFGTVGAANANAAFGYKSLIVLTTGANNTGVGALSLSAVGASSDNTALGSNAGLLATGSRNVFIGKSAGAQQTTGDDKLYIANTNTTAPLIGGDFAAQTLSINGVAILAANVATPAGGSTTARHLFGTTAGFGIYYGSGVPTVSAAKGSLYIRSDGTGANDRAFINTDGGTTWTAIVTVA